MPVLRQRHGAQAHKSRVRCDRWHESEPEWHLAWKERFPVDCQEIVRIDERSGERHIADVRTPNGFVVEIQHSPIADAELRSRETFYNRMTWIVDARDQAGYFQLGTSHDLIATDPMAYGVRWWGKQASRTMVVGPEAGPFRHRQRSTGGA